ncbi:hypothetical protein GBA65_22220 (plasmid) [Rubrobacter marinus]|uniref:Uncharacterized protein n=1 Tax=Rubrobacter marinus TaxID=2653852 RepID=A0A6G8Q3V4_9ACTN|nr:hypothetical protein [Rubrobacter marinus]QIN81152.1 hypothetical protein GBA65_22220 [Rubrobacter marinus]
MPATKPLYDKHLVRSELVRVCAHYLGPGSSQGSRHVWACPKCGKPQKFSAYPRKNTAGCLHAACEVPEKMDALAVIAYFEDLEPRGAGFVAILKRGYEILGIPDPEGGRGDVRPRPPRPAERPPKSRPRVPTENKAAPRSTANREAPAGDALPARRPPRAGATPGAKQDPRPEEPDDAVRWEGGAGWEKEAPSGAQGPWAPEGGTGWEPPPADEPLGAELAVVEDVVTVEPEHEGPDGGRVAGRKVRAHAEGRVGYRRPAEAWVMEPEVPRAGPELLDAVYREILEHCPLVGPHRDYLKGRGLSYETMEAAALGSMTKERAKRVRERLVEKFGKETLLGVPGFSSQKVTGRLTFTLSFECVIIPYHDDDSRITTLEGRCVGKPPKGMGKYVSLKGSGSHLYVFPGIMPEALVAFCEGVMGALVAAQEGIAVGSIQGFRRYQNPEDGGPLLELEGTDFAGRRIPYIPDVDDPPQPDVMAAAPDAALHLVGRQGGEPAIALLPHGKDLDEWLLAEKRTQRRALFSDLVARAVPAEEFARGSNAEEGPAEGPPAPPRTREEERGQAEDKRPVERPGTPSANGPSAAEAPADRAGPGLELAIPDARQRQTSPQLPEEVKAIVERRRAARENPDPVPPRTAMTAREAAISLAVFLAVAATLWLGLPVAVSPVADLLPSPFGTILSNDVYQALVALVVAMLSAAYSWTVMSGRRITKAQHLSGELPT